MFDYYRWDEKEFERLKSETVEGIKRGKTSARTTAFLVFSKLIYGDDNILSKNIVGTEQSVPSITLDDLKNYYPTSVLVTGYDIITFWVSRMIMTGMHFMKKEPFSTVFIHGLIRDVTGKKMSKSLGNTILLSDDAETVKQKLRKAVTDPQKVRRNDPGRPEICLVFTYHKKFNAGDIPEIETNCKNGTLGCVDCKMKCSANISSFIAPILEKRKYYETHIEEVKNILADGETRAKKVAHATMQEVREKMKLG